MNSVSCRAKISNGAKLSDLPFGKSSSRPSDEYERLKAEQSATTDLPMQAMPVAMRSGVYAAVVASARAIATREEQSTTMGNLPVVTVNVNATISAQKAQPKSASAAPPKRQLLPPPKTVFLPAGDPTELRQLVDNLRKHNQSLQQARITSRMNTLAPARTEERSQGENRFFAKCREILTTDIGFVIIAPIRRILAKYALA